MAHPQSNFTSTFNGTPLGNAKLTLSVNGVDHEYTPSGNDQTVDINGNEVVHIDDPDFVQLLNVADADKCELIIKQDITADGAYRKYRLADCHVLDGDREWRFTCTAGNIEYILTVAEDGSVTPSQRLIPGASDDLPLEDGTASAGTSNQYSRKDHVHPHDSTKEDKSNKTSYIDPTIDQSGKYLGGSAVNGFVEKRTFAISVPYNVSNNNTFTKILEYNEIYSSSTSRDALFTRLKIQFVDTYLEHRLPEVDAYIGYDLYNKKTFVTFGNCYKTVYENDYDFKNLHVVTYDDSSRCHIEVYLEHKKLTSMRQWISVEVCENFQITESSYRTYTDHSNWKIPLTNYSWDGVNGASIQPTAAALPTTGVLKTDSYIIQSGNQVPFTYMPFGTGGHEMAIAKLVGNSSYTKLVFKLYCQREGWVAIGKVERDTNGFRLSFSAIADSADFEAGVAVPYIYLSLLDGVYYVNLNIDSYHTVLESIAIEVENEKKDWEFFGSIPPGNVGTTVSGTDTYMKADLTAEVIDQGTNVPAPTPSTKVLTKQVDANGREFWKTEQMSDMTAGKVVGHAVGSLSQGVFVDSNGSLQPCKSIVKPASYCNGRIAKITWDDSPSCIPFMIKFMFDYGSYYHSIEEFTCYGEINGSMSSPTLYIYGKTYNAKSPSVTPTSSLGWISTADGIEIWASHVKAYSGAVVPNLSSAKFMLLDVKCPSTDNVNINIDTSFTNTWTPTAANSVDCVAISVR